MNLNDEIIELIKGRLEKGAKTYNQEVRSDDPRDFVKEALEESLDCAVYLCGQLLKIKHEEKDLQRTIDNLRFELNITEQTRLRDNKYLLDKLQKYETK